MSDHDNWDDPKYVKPADCDEDGYCVDCRSATVHHGGCIVLTKSISDDERRRAEAARSHTVGCGCPFCS
jgi:hypothetical protein